MQLTTDRVKTVDMKVLTATEAAIHEINGAIGMLGSACEANIFDADEEAYWWDDEQMK